MLSMSNGRSLCLGKVWSSCGPESRTSTLESAFPLNSTLDDARVTSCSEAEFLHFRNEWFWKV
jgi:hypothetical protein